jgi:XTP/dITP diphosphohydrolase
MRLVFATHNANKVTEMRQLLRGLPFAVVSADEAGVYEDVVEDGETFEANAEKKARFVQNVIARSDATKQTRVWSLADDSGLCIDALGGKPGVYSARWAGEGATGEQIVEYTLEKLRDVLEDRRQASFVSALVLVSPEGARHAFRGEVRGRIPLAPRGTHVRPKLPYDVIFEPDGTGRTFAEMTDEEKNSLSHRGLAFNELRTYMAALK